MAGVEAGAVSRAAKTRAAKSGAGGIGAKEAGVVKNGAAVSGVAVYGAVRDGAVPQISLAVKEVIPLGRVDKGKGILGGSVLAVERPTVSLLVKEVWLPRWGGGGNGKGKPGHGLSMTSCLGDQWQVVSRKGRRPRSGLAEVANVGEAGSKRRKRLARMPSWLLARLSTRRITRWGIPLVWRTAEVIRRVVEPMGWFLFMEEVMEESEAFLLIAVSLWVNDTLSLPDVIMVCMGGLEVEVAISAVGFPSLCPMLRWFARASLVRLPEARLLYIPRFRV
ncbi:hypothetical protein QJS10_CPB04g01093 [Acorus calamus]|uniref:Uncharacterized protein n=1 Tax=Acorus calamus TaxID=4465 RepID=A0AAV9F203_ACOCL|nr:hypothetical protein QJS10_CPB04g01093 [Acorus calamus]